MNSNAKHQAEYAPGYSGIFVFGDLPDTVSKKMRSYIFFLVKSPIFMGVLQIVQAEHLDVYAVEEVTSEDNEFAAVFRCFVLAKCELKDDQDEWLYYVRLPGRLNHTAKPSCQCFGYNSHQRCKHIDVLRDLLNRGQL